MKAARLGVITVVVVLLVAVASWWQGAPSEGRKVSLDSAVPAVGRSDSLSSTWFCSVGGLGSEPAPQHLMRLTNSSDRPAGVRLTAFGAKGEVGQRVVEVPARTVQNVDVASTFNAPDLSVMAESTDGSLAVEHGLVLKDMADVVPCATHSSNTWYFPTQSSVKGSRALLVLFNPFSADASVVVAGAVPDGVRSPTAWNGVVVPAGSTRVLDLGEQFSVREQFSVSVRLKSGQVLAETVQTLDLEATDKAPVVHGLRLQPGVAAPREAWTFAGGFRDSGATEKVFLQNPGSETTTVSLQVVPYRSGDMPPEPFSVEVPAGRYAMLDLTGEGRVPDVGFHSIRIQAAKGHPVVAVRTISVSGEPPAEATGGEGETRPSITAGAAASVGSPFATRSWLIPAVTTGPGNRPIGFIHNPQAGIVRVSVSATSGGGEAVEVVKDAEIAPGDGLAVDLSPKALDQPGLRYYRITASQPVAVDRLVTLGAANDFSFSAAMPIEP